MTSPSHWLADAAVAQFEAAGTDAHRVYNQENAWIERFGRDYLVSAVEPARFGPLGEELRRWCEAHGLPLDRIFGKPLADTESERLAPRLLHGDAALPPLTTVRENGMRFGLDFSAGYSSGLFIDQRANRALWRAQPPKRFLNCFAYTCSFSVATALVGAETVSVDLSKKSLERGRTNFALNDLDATRHRFIADDVFGVLPYLKRRGETFDGIVLDPPTFSRGTKSKVFRVERDFAALLDLALDLAMPDARLLLSTNCTRLRRRDLETIARAAASQRNRRVTLTPSSSLPDIPESGRPTTVWLALE